MQSRTPSPPPSSPIGNKMPHPLTTLLPIPTQPSFLAILTEVDYKKCHNCQVLAHVSNLFTRITIEKYYLTQGKHASHQEMGAFHAAAATAFKSITFMICRDCLSKLGLTTFALNYKKQFKTKGTPTNKRKPEEQGEAEYGQKQTPPKKRQYTKRNKVFDVTTGLTTDEVLAPESPTTKEPEPQEVEDTVIITGTVPPPQASSAVKKSWELTGERQCRFFLKLVSAMKETPANRHIFGKFMMQFENNLNQLAFDLIENN